jgi:ABC-type antimicrobial peptide transport system permease subunit
MNRDLPVAEMRDMETIVAESTARLSFTMIALAIAASVALLLGGIGLYGVLSYVVNQRTREMGVRIALGAEVNQVRWMVVRQGMMVAGAGLVVGIGASLYLARVLESLLYGTSPTDLVTFVTTSGVLMAVALLASYVPARRASAIDPMEALRAE